MQSKFIQRLLVLWRVSGQPGAKYRIFQFFESFWLAGTREFSPGEYWVYGFHMRSENRNVAKRYLSSRIYFKEVIPTLNNRKVISFLENKWLFFLHFKDNDIRTPHCYGVYHKHSGFLSGGKVFKASELTSLVIENGIRNFIAKPLAGTGGRDVYRITVENINSAPSFHVKGIEFDAASLLDYLAQKISITHNCGFLVQEYISQHESLSALSPSASMNIRIITLMRPNGEVVITSASTRIGRLGAVVSNAGSGGLLAKVDSNTGTIVKCRSNAYIDATESDVHPDTQVQIVGAKLPFWKETVELCLRAALLIPDAYSIGWDVLINSDGPILLEGNHDWDIISEQLFGEGYLTELNTKMLSEHGLNFSGITALDFRPKKIFQFIR